ESGAQIVRLLGRGPDDSLTIRNLRENSAALHRVRGAAMNEEIIAHNMRRFGKGRLDVTVSDLVRDNAIVAQLAAHRRRAVTPAIRRGRQKLVVDGDKSCRILRDVTILRQYDGHRFADK